MDQVAFFMHLAGMEDPEPTATGSFTNPEFSEAFAALARMGRQTMVLALETGARVEEMDIADLNKALAQTRNPELMRLYTHLRAASGRHLTKFVDHLERHGKTFTPKYLSPTEISVILEWNRTAASRPGI
jgi:hypothetical protein